MQPDRFNPLGRKLSPAIISLIVIVIIGAIAATVYIATRENSDQADSSSMQSTDTGTSGDTTTDSSTTSENSAEYTDGTYTATGSYSTPGGTESVTVTAALVDGKVTTVSTTGSATGGNSAQYQSMFLSSYESLVEGKSIDSISLSRVSGSSLTSNGFNAAIEEIKRDALS